MMKLKNPNDAVHLTASVRYCTLQRADGCVIEHLHGSHTLKHTLNALMTIYKRKKKHE